MSRAPKVSIGLLSYNHARWLPFTLKSALSQTYRDFEIVLVDDGSTDDSLEIARDFEARHPSRVRVYTHPDGENRGIYETATATVRLSRGEYWLGLASDDLLYEKALELEVPVMERDARVGLVYGLNDKIDADGKSLGPAEARDLSNDPNPVLTLLRACCIGPQGVLIRRRCFDDLGFWNPECVGADWEMFVRIAATWDLRFVDQPVAAWRRHGYSTSAVEAVRGKYHQLAVIRSLFNDADRVGGLLSEKRTQAVLALYVAYLARWVGDREESEQALSRVAELDPQLQSDYQFLMDWLLLRHRDGHAVAVLRKLLEKTEQSSREPTSREERQYRSIITSLSSVDRLNPLWVLRKAVNFVGFEALWLLRNRLTLPYMRILGRLWLHGPDSQVIDPPRNNHA